MVSVLASAQQRKLEADQFEPKVDKLMSPEAKTKDELFGFIEQLKPTGKAFPFAGGFEGANTAYYEVLRDEISIIVFANMDEPVAENMAGKRR